MGLPYPILHIRMSRALARRDREPGWNISMPWPGRWFGQSHRTGVRQYLIFSQKAAGAIPPGTCCLGPFPHFFPAVNSPGNSWTKGLQPVADFFSSNECCARCVRRGFRGPCVAFFVGMDFCLEVLTAHEDLEWFHDFLFADWDWPLVTELCVTCHALEHSPLPCPTAPPEVARPLLPAPAVWNSMDREVRVEHTR